MSLSIVLATDKLPEKGSLIITATDGGKLGALGKQLDKKIGGVISKAIKIKKFKGKPASMFALLAPAKSSLDRIVVLGVGDGKKLGVADAEKMGGTALGAVEKAEGDVTFLLEPLGSNVADGEIAARAAVGAYLRDYKFEIYKTKNKSSAGPKKFTVATKATAPAKKAFAELKAIADGTIVARNLVNEPSNVLTPKEFAKRTKVLAKLGVKVEVLSEAQMKKLGMGSLLGVGQGSVQPSQMVVMQWNGAAKSKQPVAFVGKGVCFDTGGLNIKPGNSMGLMKKDMGGAANVLALARAIMGLDIDLQLRVLIPAVENSIAGTAFRPGDILKSRKGLSVEINNTDAEGRLILADALSYASEDDPHLIISMATLTGAARIALGTDLAPFYAGLDSDATAISEASVAAMDPVWRMPFWDPYDKLIEPQIADLDNAPAGGFAGSITAALFLRRFVKNPEKYIHFDIYSWQQNSSILGPKGGLTQGPRAILLALDKLLSI